MCYVLCTMCLMANCGHNKRWSLFSVTIPCYRWCRFPPWTSLDRRLCWRTDRTSPSLFHRQHICTRQSLHSSHNALQHSVPSEFPYNSFFSFRFTTSGPVDPGAEVRCHTRASPSSSPYPPFSFSSTPLFCPPVFFSHPSFHPFLPLFSLLPAFSLPRSIELKTRSCNELTFGLYRAPFSVLLPSAGKPNRRTRTGTSFSILLEQFGAHQQGISTVNYFHW